MNTSIAHEKVRWWARRRAYIHF